MTPVRVGVVNRFTARDRGGYPLGLALQRIGADYVPVDVRDVRVALGSEGPPRISVGDRDLDDLRLSGFVWRVSENDFHQFADVQCQLAARLPMVNPWPCNAVCANKWRTSLVLAAAGLPVVPSTLLVPGMPAPAFDGAATVIKPVVGARGRGVRVVPAGSDPRVDEAHVAQPMVSSAVHDQIRALVCGEARVLAAHRVPGRAGADHQVQVNNLEAGGTPLPAHAEPVRDLALAVARCLGGSLLGIDLVRWNDGWAVLEANSAPGLGGIARVADVDCYELAAEAVLAGIYRGSVA